LQLVFDNYTDIDRVKQITGQVSLNFGSLAGNDLRGSYYYRNVTGVTFATIGAGEIVQRGAAPTALFLLNREAGNFQRVTASETIDIKIPGINLLRVVQGITDAADLYRAVTAQVPDSVMGEGPAAAELDFSAGIFPIYFVQEGAAVKLAERVRPASTT
jgi:hypothetical protein